MVRPVVFIAGGDGDDEMLTEWLGAAGFEPRVIGEQPPCSSDEGLATLLRWPTAMDLAALPAPVIVLYEPGADLHEVVGKVHEAMALPDSQDVRSLLAWSKHLFAVLYRFVPAPPPAGPADGGKSEASRACTKAAVSPVATGSVPAASVARPGTESSASGSSAPSSSARADAPRLIAIGISTGGPASLRVLFEGMRGVRDLPPIVIVQHIPAAYVQDLVDRLQSQTGYRMQFAADGIRLQAGVAYISPGDHHLRVCPRGDAIYAQWDDAPPVRGHCPAVDILFDSCQTLKGNGVAVMMTGMGRDGAEPMRKLRESGWQTVGQNEESCTIYGMPGAAKAAGAVQRELSLEQIAPWLVSYCHRAMQSA